MTQTNPQNLPGSGVECMSRIPTPHFDVIPQAIQPVWELGATLQSEWLTLCSHRAQAWMDWPGRMCACKTADDLARAQTEYLTAMQRDYAEYVEGILRDTLMERDELEEVEGGETPGSESRQERGEEPVHRVAA